jgi:hypothetical protein
MALEVAHGSFLEQLAPGNFSIGGLTFDPIAYVFWGNDSPDDSTVAGPTGAMGLATSAADQATVGYILDDGANLNRGRIDNTLCYVRVTRLAAITSEIAFVSNDVGGFTLNQVTAPAVARRVFFLALGGADLTNAKVLEYITPLGIGDDPVTGMGFEPDALIQISSGHPTNPPNFVADPGLIVSLYDGANAYCSSRTIEGIFTPIMGGRIQSNANYFLNIDGNTLVGSAVVKSLDPDGFTLTYALTGPGPRTCWVLGLKGGTYNVGTGKVPIVASSPSYVTPGVSPVGLFITSTSQNVFDTVAGSWMESDGGGTSAASVGVAGSYAITATNSAKDGAQETDDIYLSYTPGPPVLLQRGTISTLDPGGFTLTFDTVDGVNDDFGWMAFGEPFVPPGNGNIVSDCPCCVGFLGSAAV